MANEYKKLLIKISQENENNQSNALDANIHNVTRHRILSKGSFDKDFSYIMHLKKDKRKPSLHNSFRSIKPKK